MLLSPYLLPKMIVIESETGKSKLGRLTLSPWLPVSHCTVCKHTLAHTQLLEKSFTDLQPSLIATEQQGKAFVAKQTEASQSCECDNGWRAKGGDGGRREGMEGEGRGWRAKGGDGGRREGMEGKGRGWRAKGGDGGRREGWRVKGEDGGRREGNLGRCAHVMV